jgi:methyl-accepting chemotaxis protein
MRDYAMTADTTNPDTAVDLKVARDDTHQSTAPTSRSSSMSVGFKIYGIVGLCLALLAVVGGGGVWQMGKIGAELESIAEVDIPLTSGLTKVTFHQLEQAVNFERAFRFGQEMTRHAEIRKDFEKTVHKFEQLSSKVETELKEVETRAENAGHVAHTAAEKAEFAHVVTAIKKIEVEHKAYETVAVQALTLLNTGKVEDAAKLEHKIVELEDKLDHELGALLTEVLTFTEKAAKTAEAHEHFAIQLLIGLAIAAFAVGGLASFLLVRSAISRPLNEIVGALDALTKGNLDVEITARSNDEIGSVTKALGVFKISMIESRRLEAQQAEAEKKALEDEAHRAEEKRTAEADKREAEAQAEAERRQGRLEMADSFEKSVMGVVESLSSAAIEMQSSAETMSATADQTNKQATAVAAASEEATVNVQTVASSAEELSASIEEISRQVIQSNQIAQNAVNEAKQTNEKVEGLAAAAQKIGDVVNLINDIASQTNLLALNATIEAARAGDAGKGFAVVASEVKSLATQTGKATEEIGAHIHAIQTETQAAVEAIQGIGSTVGQMGEIATSVASAVEEQGSATREIANSVQQAAAGTQEVSSNITQVTQAASETQASSGQMLGAAKELAQQGDVLRIEVDKFLNEIRAA